MFWAEICGYCAAAALQQRCAWGRACAGHLFLTDLQEFPQAGKQELCHNVPAPLSEQEGCTEAGSLFTSKWGLQRGPITRENFCPTEHEVRPGSLRLAASALHFVRFSDVATKHSQSFHLIFHCSLLSLKKVFPILEQWGTGYQYTDSDKRKTAEFKTGFPIYI